MPKAFPFSNLVCTSSSILRNFASSSNLLSSFLLSLLSLTHLYSCAVSLKCRLLEYLLCIIIWCSCYSLGSNRVCPTASLCYSMLRVSNRLLWVTLVSDWYSILSSTLLEVFFWVFLIFLIFFIFPDINSSFYFNPVLFSSTYFFF